MGVQCALSANERHHALSGVFLFLAFLFGLLSVTEHSKSKALQKHKDKKLRVLQCAHRIPSARYTVCSGLDTVAQASG